MNYHVNYKKKKKHVIKAVLSDNTLSNEACPLQCFKVSWQYYVSTRWIIKRWYHNGNWKLIIALLKGKWHMKYLLQTASSSITAENTIKVNNMSLKEPNYFMTSHLKGISWLPGKLVWHNWFKGPVEKENRRTTFVALQYSWWCMANFQAGPP